MDPNTNLKEQLELARNILKERKIERLEDCEPGVIEIHDDARELAERVLALHDWINNQGALPAEWCGKGGWISLKRREE